MIHIDIKYSNLLSVKLENFSIKNQMPYLANCRCPICGDSKTNSKKARGYIYTKNHSLFYRCHNCSAGLSIGNLVKRVDPSLFKEYCFEKYKNDGPTEPPPDIRRTSPPKVVKETPLRQLKKISQLAPNHPAKQYIVKRKIPSDKHYKLFYAPKFMTWVNSFEPGKFKDFKKDEPRLIIPFIDRQNNLVAIQGRSFDPKGIRYITIRLDFDAPLVYNLNSIDLSKTIYCTEGPIDSMFLPNAISVASSDIQRVNNILPKDKTVFIFDNQPRNPEVVGIMEKAVKSGNTLVIWPDKIELKDINDMVMAGIEPLSVVQNNKFSGPSLSMKFAAWRKC